MSKLLTVVFGPGGEPSESVSQEGRSPDLSDIIDAEMLHGNIDPLL